MKKVALYLIPSLLIGAALLIGLLAVGKGIAARNQNMISVTGSASQDAVSDEASWTINLRRTSLEQGIPQATDAISKDAEAIQKYFNDQHLASSTVTISTVSVNQDYSYNKTGNEPTSYMINETVSIATSDVNKIDTLSHDIGSLNRIISRSTILSPQAPQYFINQLPELRVSLLGKAVKDAHARAESIASSGGSSVGALASASSGVVQVLAPNSTNIEGYGQYDTSSIKKQVMVTAHVSFYVSKK